MDNTVLCNQCGDPPRIQLCHTCHADLGEGAPYIVCSNCDGHFCVQPCGEHEQKQYRSNDAQRKEQQLLQQHMYADSDDDDRSVVRTDDDSELELTRCSNCDPYHVEQATFTSWMTTVHEMKQYAEQIQRPNLAQAAQAVTDQLSGLVGPSAAPATVLKRHAIVLPRKRKAYDTIDSVRCGACAKQLRVRPTVAGRPSWVPNDSNTTIINCDWCQRPYCASCAEGDPGWNKSIRTLECCKRCPFGERSDQRAERLAEQERKQQFDDAIQRMAQQLPATSSEASRALFRHILSQMEPADLPDSSDAMYGLMIYEMKTCIQEVKQNALSFSFLYCPPDVVSNPYAKLTQSDIRGVCEAAIRTYQMHPPASNVSATSIEMVWNKSSKFPTVAVDKNRQTL